MTTVTRTIKVRAASSTECPASAAPSLAFGNPIPSTTYDPDILKGWGKRGYNWEGSVAVQQELVRNVSLDVGYFRRWYGNFLATDNLALAAADFNQFSVVAPNDSRLPSGGGQTIRLNQLDLRVGKILKLGRTKTALNVDLFNAFNDNAVLTENASFAVFRQPLSVLNPRLVKFSVNFDF